ncbi:hypothetical protein TNCV_1185581 [Trichonephila clavipes]|nr:hypothetical protein TNCV_1185581 [Trichonephila clavipes]
MIGAGFELITSNCASLKEFASFGSNRHVRQIGESLVIWVEAMRPLDDSDKNRWTVADFSVMMLEVDIGPQQIGRTD